MNRRKLSAGLVVGAMALLGLGVTGGVADAAPPALPGPSIFTLPLPVPLAVTVTTGPGGAITDVSVGAPVDPAAPVVDPAAPVDPAADPALSVSKARPGKVVFTTEADGVRVSIRSKGQTQTLTARAASIDAFLNPAGGSWAGEVFPGVQGVVPYIIGGTADAPTITVGAITGGGVAADPVTKIDDDGEEISVRVVVTFTNATQTRDLSIRLKVENESDDDDDDDSSDEGHASLSITLGKIRGLAGAEVAGPKTWGAILCDGTAGTITYDVAADGTISNVKAMVDGAEVDARINAEGGKASVRFPTDERIKISVKVEATGGLTINVSEKIRCRDAAAPTINGQPADIVGDDGDDDHHDGDHHGGGDQGGGHHGGDDKKSDD